MSKEIILHKDLQFILNNFHFESLTEYVLNGLKRNIRDINIIDPSGILSKAWKSLEQEKSKFLMTLTSDIYNNLYSYDASKKEISNIEIHTDFVLRLSSANHGSGVWESGWEYLGKDSLSNLEIVKKDGLVFWINKDNIRFSGTRCMIKKEKEVKYLNSFFYFAFGNAGMVGEYSKEIVRFYWNLTPYGAICFLDELTNLFNEKNIPFTAKVLSDSTKYNRTDAGVLYINQNKLPKALPLIEKIFSFLSKECLGLAVPMFTKQLFPGVGFAEDPGNKYSFGLSRSKIIAEALLSSYSISNSTLKAEQELKKAFLLNNLDPSLPYASAKRLNDYELFFKALEKHGNSVSKNTNASFSHS